MSDSDSFSFDWGSFFSVLGSVASGIFSTATETQAADQAQTLLSIQKEEADREKKRLEEKEDRRYAEQMRMAKDEVKRKTANDRWERKMAERQEKVMSLDNLLGGAVKRANEMPAFRDVMWNRWSGGRRRTA